MLISIVKEGTWSSAHTLHMAHASAGFISDFLKHCRENIPKQAKPIFAVGEYFSEEVGAHSGYCFL